jgi:hypothetical protein
MLKDGMQVLVEGQSQDTYSTVVSEPAWLTLSTAPLISLVHLFYIAFSRGKKKHV